MDEELDDMPENGTGNDLYEHFNLKVDKGQELLRIDKFLLAKIANSTRTKIQQACDNGHVFVNTKPVKSNYKVKPGDEISIQLSVPKREIEIVPEDIPINIVYEDDCLAIINKKAGMVVHPGYGNYTGTLVNALAFYFNNLPSRKNKIDTAITLDRIGLVHRIDKNTSGIIMIAKTEHCMASLSKLFFDHDIDRKYVALVWGNLKEDEGTIRGNVGRDIRNRKVMAVYPEGSVEGKHAVTHYKVIKRFAYITLVECKLETGRTHQIRVHFKHIGHPLFNDSEYGGDKILKGVNTANYRRFITNCFELLPRQALHAKTLGFTHPITGENHFFESEIPEDMQQVILKWENFTDGKLSK